MKNLITLINLSIMFGITAIFTSYQTSPKEVGETVKATISQDIGQSLSNKMKGAKSGEIKELTARQKSVEEFLIESAEARLMDLEEGKTAEQRGTSRALKDYGSLMVKDQSQMLADLKTLAVQKTVKLPATLGKNKLDGLTDLKEKHGKSFDKKFIKMMLIDHKRDVKKFERALKSDDPDVQVFATKYLPVIQSHLDKIKSLKKSH